jgi:hypothetical protein
MPTVPRLFDIFSANLGLYRKDDSGRFMCPLCLRLFSRDQIRTDLSKAHIIPKFLGGRDWALACRTCNNKVGAEIESCEAERAKANWALSGDGNDTILARIIVRNERGDIVGPVQANMKGVRCGGDRRLQLRLQPKGSNPAALKLLNDQLSGITPAGRSSPEVHFPVTRSTKRANLTYVHAAYLHMFHQFGYEWALNPSAEPVRKQIMSPDEPIILPLFPNLSDHQIPDDKLALLLVTQPPDWRHFLVVIPLFRGLTRRQAVWMPLFGRPYEQPPQRKGIKLAVVPLPDHHQFLHGRDSYMQGFRFLLDHFMYDPVLYADPNCFGKYG